MEKLKNVLAFTVATITTLGAAYFLFLVGREIGFSSLTLVDLGLIIGAIALYFLVSASFKRVEGILDRKIKELDEK